ncbi:JAB domain-containing protein [Limosilactobacillus pontis]|uniref:JAB domain-containing protein n=1 Tax=Limosilactobacillus pontis TaxID=35787 RepID=UPI0025A48E01|nr:JAB domain-containing protein [Limosilactobacillus pontis]MDM8331227.1 JAB domain-containing protein [Limosilactobacillus pontis]
MEEQKLTGFQATSLYERAIRCCLSDVEIHGISAYRYLQLYYPDLIDLKQISRNQRDELCQCDQRINEFFMALDLGAAMVKVYPEIEGVAYSSVELGQAMIAHFAGEEQESVCVAFTDAQNNIIKLKTLFIGGRSECVLYPDQIFKHALRYSASGLVMVHNHPSGNIKPSQQDLAFAKRLERGGKLLGIQVLDFMIVGNDQYYSWREQELQAQS